MKHILIFLSFFSSPLFGQSMETGVLFKRVVNGKFEWCKNGDEDKDRIYLGEIKNENILGKIVNGLKEG